MKGTYSVTVKNNVLQYQFEIRRNITIIKGDSATGKTTLVDMIREYDQNGEQSGITLICQKTCVVLEGRQWKVLLENIHDSIVFIDEGNKFITTDEFSFAIKQSDNYYVIVTREGLPNLPYSVEEIYGIKKSGKYGTLRQTYQEFYRIYGDVKKGVSFQPESFEWLILKADVIRDNTIAEILEHPSDFIDSKEYMSWERFFTAVLVDKTKDTYLRYSKSKLNEAYKNQKIKGKILQEIPDQLM